MPLHKASVRVHLTNIAGLGAIQLLNSLLPALEGNKGIQVVETYLPDRGELASYTGSDPLVRRIHYRRYLPNALSRLVECMLPGSRFDSAVPLLVMGDLPIRCRAPQTVFVQTPHLLYTRKKAWSVTGLKRSLLRLVFRLNIRYAQAVIVQTTFMRDALISSYPSLHSRVHVIAQPVPAWLLKSGLKRERREGALKAPLRLIYPAAGYPHKNHRLLAAIDQADVGNWPIESLVITLAAKSNPAAYIPWLRCVDRLVASQMLDAYESVDGLLFLSRDESYGFPLVEAMFAGLPIICPDLPYARVLCGDEAIYFQVDDAGSLKHAVNELHEKLTTGYWPDWSEQLKAIPKDWETVAQSMLKIAVSPSAETPNELNARDD
ncbi:glycosyl transferase family 1 [Pseudomonas sp. Fl5BN2]|uniref:glycosyltransferase family 4 protein n=1 Tax=Pseudomonas sp. Fl5BN2 TaxID=2697652 RepID=UPI001378BA00|nr:glycosyltransferase family 4 protein [Pseudomonas sp. Fl5BN2]NBF03349.1 glycosyl transferase family 1 [Pseudomonas sp. Fl5BN2]